MSKKEDQLCGWSMVAGVMLVIIITGLSYLAHEVFIYCVKETTKEEFKYFDSKLDETIQKFSDLHLDQSIEIDELKIQLNKGKGK